MRRLSRDAVRRLRRCAAGGLVVLLSVATSLGTTSGQFAATATATTSLSTRAACTTGSPTAALLGTPGFAPTLWWRFANLTGTTTVADASGNGLTGTVVNAGLTFGTANVGLVSCDTTYALRQPGAATSTGFVTTTASTSAPTTFSIATWVRTTATTGGRIVGFSSSSTAGSATQDRALLLDRSGRVVFHMAAATGNVLLTAPTAISDNLVHLVVATYTAGVLTLYVDGSSRGTATVTTPAAPYTGFWRCGWDQNVATLIPTSRNQAAVRQDEVAVWQGRALTASDVATLWASNHW
jgi:hypothetical protein